MALLCRTLAKPGTANLFKPLLLAPSFTPVSTQAYSYSSSSGNGLGSILRTVTRALNNTSPTEEKEITALPVDKGFDTHSKDFSDRRHFGVRVIPNQEEWIVERLGGFKRIARPGLNFFLPVFDKIAYSHTLKEQMFRVNPQPGITKDNVSVLIDGNVYVQVTNTKDASYHSERPYSQIVELTQTIVRTLIGRLTLDECQEKREWINTNMREALAKETQGWGIDCTRYEIRQVTPSAEIRKEMDRQSTAERRRRETVKEAEGRREAEITIAEGKKLAAIAEAEGGAQAQKILADAQAEYLRIVGAAMKESPEAAQLDVAKKFAESWGEFAKSGSSSLIVPADLSNIPTMVGTAFESFKTMSKENVSLEDRIKKDDTNYVK